MFEEEDIVTYMTIPAMESSARLVSHTPRMLLKTSPSRKAKKPGKSASQIPSWRGASTHWQCIGSDILRNAI